MSKCNNAVTPNTIPNTTTNTTSNVTTKFICDIGQVYNMILVLPPTLYNYANNYDLIVIKTNVKC